MTLVQVVQRRDEAADKARGEVAGRIRGYLLLLVKVAVCQLKVSLPLPLAPLKTPTYSCCSRAFSHSQRTWRSCAPASQPSRPRRDAQSGSHSYCCAA